MITYLLCNISCCSQRKPVERRRLTGQHSPADCKQLWENIVLTCTQAVYTTSVLSQTDLVLTYCSSASKWAKLNNCYYYCSQKRTLFSEALSCTCVQTVFSTECTVYSVNHGGRSVCWGRSNQCSQLDHAEPWTKGWLPHNTSLLLLWWVLHLYYPPYPSWDYSKTEKGRLLFRLQWFLLFLRLLQTGDGCLMKDFFVSLGHWLNFWQALIIATKIFFTKIY